MPICRKGCNTPVLLLLNGIGLFILLAVSYLLLRCCIKESGINAMAKGGQTNAYLPKGCNAPVTMCAINTFVIVSYAVFNLRAFWGQDRCSGAVNHVSTWTVVLSSWFQSIAVQTEMELLYLHRDITWPKLLVRENSVNSGQEGEGQQKQRTVHKSLFLLSFLSFFLFLFLFLFLLFLQVLVRQMPICPKGAMSLLQCVQ